MGKSLKIRLACALALALAAGAAWLYFTHETIPAGPALDASRDRVATSLALDAAFTRLGTLRPRSVAEIGDSDFTIGCETLDRGYANFEAYKSYLPPLGIKKLRIQGGWARCEKEKGVFDFAWLDKIVDWSVAHKLEPMICCVFGNPLYADEKAKGLFARIPTEGEAYAAWRRWIDTLAKHYAKRVRYYETWNEPNNVPGNTPEVIATNNIETAEIIRAHRPDAVISGMVLGRRDEYEAILGAYAASGKHKLIDNVSVHLYDLSPEFGVTWLDWAIERANALTPGIKVRQGEAGAVSEMIPRFGFAKWPFTEISQAKWDMRRMLVDHSRGVDSTVFQISDMHYDGVEGTFNNAKGLLRANEAREIIQIKRAYYAVQNVVSVFDRTLQHVATNEMAYVCQDETVWFDEYRTKAKRPVLAFWQWQTRETQLTPKGTLRREKAYPLPSDSCLTRTFYFEGKAPFVDPVWVDLLSGRVYKVPESCQIVHSCGVSFVNIPVYDSPCLLADRASLNIDFAKPQH
ncbi:MAG: hypothetical protein MJ240_05455 [Kiritimatiellae bacterium]|nr:hypothetical protein [Kiritimatiellia bacterium]